MSNKLLTTKGNIKVFCRTRPLLDDEGPSVVEFPDDYTIRVSTDDANVSNPKRDYEFDRVYRPHVSQAVIFSDVQPLVQSALDGYNVSIFCYGQSHSGKTHTLEGCSSDSGLYVRCFEELFDVSNSDTASASRFDFCLSVFELYNDQIRDLLSVSGDSKSKILLGTLGPEDSLVNLLQEKVDNSAEFSKVLTMALKNRGADVLKFDVSHLIITIYIYNKNLNTNETVCSKISLVDLAGSSSLNLQDEAGSSSLNLQDDGGEQATDLLHVMKSLSALGDVMTCLTSEKDIVPYERSTLTKVLADSIGGSSKTLMIVNLCPNKSNLTETIASLNFAARARHATLGHGGRDTIKKWMDVANDARWEMYEKEKECNGLKQEVMFVKQALKHANDQCVLLFNEVQKAWKVLFTIQSDLKSENNILAEKHKTEKDQNAQLRSQVAQLLKVEQDQKLQMQQRDSTIEILQDKLRSIESELNKAHLSNDDKSTMNLESRLVAQSTSNANSQDTESVSVTKKLEEELIKRDALIERLHEENEKLFERLTEKAASARLPQVSNSSPKLLTDGQAGNSGRNDSTGKGRSADAAPFSTTSKIEGSTALVKAGPDKAKTTPAGEYLTSALNDFDPDKYDGLATISDGANKLLMLVLAAVIKAGASREHEILSEIRDSVISFIRKMEPKRVMDTVLVSRVRILYLRSLLSRSPELQSIKILPVDRFLEKANNGRSRSPSRGSSPGRSPSHLDSSMRNALVDQHVQRLKINIKPEKKSKLSSVVLKIRGIDQEAWRHHMTGEKLREITDEAKAFAVGNKALAALVVHTPTGELLRQISSWLADNFDFLSVTSDEGPTGQIELLSTAITDGWMAGLGVAMPPSTDALGQLLGEYAKRVYNSQLQHLKDIAGTLATEIAEDSLQVAKLRSALESVDHKRRKLLQQMRNDEALLTLQDGGSPIRNPSTAAEDARLASLISLDVILKQVKDIIRQSSVNTLAKSKKRAILASLDELEERMPSLLDMDHPCAQMHIAEARHAVERISEEDDVVQETPDASKVTAEFGSGPEIDVAQWNVLQFNTGSTTPFIIKCGANSNSELVIKADARVEDPKSGEIVRVVPRPTILENMTLEEMKGVFGQLPEALSLLSLARTSDGTRARYSRLYRTLAMKVPALRDLVGELEKGGELKDVRS
ncbi:kinesin-like protein KIN-14B isoform X2 [Apium graveolens]